MDENRFNIFFMDYEFLKDNSSMMPQGGHLYVVATPIGNMGDITLRAMSILKQVDYVACEDTRVTRRLLSLIGSDRPTLSYHDSNEKSQAFKIADLLQGGASVALVCDAGTPTLSDPGFRLVRECRKRQFQVIPVPGASALIAALSASGLPTHGFFFAGFLQPKSSKRTQFFKEHAGCEYPVILYESCHRIGSFLEDLKEVLGSDRYISVGREITKLHETFFVGRVGEVAMQLKPSLHRGEFVVIIAPSDFQL